MATGNKTGGRKKGTPNKATADVRAAIAKIAEASADDLGKWLRRVARSNPAKAADLYLRLIEYHIPRLARTEVTGKDGGSIVIVSQRGDDGL